MRLNDNPVRAIRIAANVGLWGTLFFAMLTIAEYYLAEYVWENVITTEHSIIETINPMKYISCTIPL